MAQQHRGGSFDEYRARVVREQLDKADFPVGEDGEDGGDVRILVSGKEKPNSAQANEIIEGLSGEVAGLRFRIEALQQEIAQKERLRRAVEHIPVLFDTSNFGDVEGHISELEEAGIRNVNVGGSMYTTTELRGLLKSVMYASEKIQKKPEGASVEEIDKLLSELGVTRKKISPHSRFGFRDCMKACIEDDTRTLWH